MTTRRSTHEADLRIELARLESEIENLRTLFAHTSGEDSRRDERRSRRIARTSRVESTATGTRTLRTVSPSGGMAARVAAALAPEVGLAPVTDLASARARRPASSDELDGPDAA